AQYKPILLLSVIDLISQQVINENKIFVSDELLNTFNKYWNILASEYKGGLHYPFFHLQNEGFWHLVLKPNFNGLQPKTTNKLKQAVEYAFLDNELFELIQEPGSRKELIDTLITVWFSASQKEPTEILNINDNFQGVTDQELEEFTSKSKVVVNNDFCEESPNMKPIRDFQGETILLPDSEKYLPSLESIQWHRNNIFRA
ncbi:MAG TPA: hypothetical protein DCF68_07685, partial [Cyanothece sp. UBA12306]|nr:hypothetical protein [Cyanothece sp. UBA12306]